MTDDIEQLLRKNKEDMTYHCLSVNRLFLDAEIPGLCIEILGSSISEEDKKCVCENLEKEYRDEINDTKNKALKQIMNYYMDDTFSLMFEVGKFLVGNQSDNSKREYKIYENLIMTFVSVCAPTMSMLYAVSYVANKFMWYVVRNSKKERKKYEETYERLLSGIVEFDLSLRYRSFINDLNRMQLSKRMEQYHNYFSYMADEYDNMLCEVD